MENDFLSQTLINQTKVDGQNEKKCIEYAIIQIQLSLVSIKCSQNQRCQNEWYMENWFISVVDTHRGVSQKEGLGSIVTWLTKNERIQND